MNASILRRFSFISALLWIGGTLVLAVSLTYYVEHQMFREVSLASLDYLQAATQALPTNAELNKIRSGKNQEHLAGVLAPLLGRRNVVTIKLYNKSGRLLYHSHAPEQVGKFFPDNPHLKRALAGERAITVSDLSHSEHVAERRLGVDRLLEIYLPLLDPNSGAIRGAYEIYTSLDPLYERLFWQRLTVWGIVLGGALLLYGGLFIHFKRASGTIIAQSREIEEKAENLEKTLAELKSAQTDLIRSEKLATLGQLATSVAHEVGNPLGSIMGMVDLLLRDKDGPAGNIEQKEYLERIGSEVMRLKKTIRSLLDYSRPAQANIGSLDLNMLVEKTLPLFRMQKRYSSVEVRTEFAEPAPRAWGDEGLAEHILLNLLLNAGQAMKGRESLTVSTQNGGSKGKSDLHVGPLEKGAPDVCVLEVRDNGPGIDPDLLPRIFDPFVTNHPSNGGAGLGLAICLRLIEEMKGALEVDSKIGEGSTFRVLLPSEPVVSSSPMKERTPVG